MIVPATLASIAIHCVQAHTRCMNRLSVKTEPLVSTFAMLAINPNARSSTDRLEASSKRYNIPVSNFSMVVNCFMRFAPFKAKKLLPCYKAGKQRELLGNGIFVKEQFYASGQLPEEKIR